MRASWIPRLPRSKCFLLSSERAARLHDEENGREFAARFVILILLNGTTLIRVSLPILVGRRERSMLTPHNSGILNYKRDVIGLHVHLIILLNFCKLLQIRCYGLLDY